MSPDPKVSVILCGYNQAEYLKDAIESVLSQTYSNIELIAIDNGSTDHSAKILSTYQGHPKVKLLLFPENGPITQRCNAGVQASSGELISILYADDYYLPEKTERQVAFFKTLPSEVGVVYSPGYRLNVLTGKQFPDFSMATSGMVLEEMLQNYYKNGFINPVSPLIKRQCLLDYPFHEDSFMEGEAVFLRIAITYPFAYFEDRQVVMRDHLNNLGKAFKKNRDHVLFLVKKLKMEKGFPEPQRLKADYFMAQVLKSHGWQGIRVASDPAWARETLLLSIRWWPKMLFQPKIVVGLGLSVLPANLIRMMNRMYNRFKPSLGNIAIRESY